MNIKKERVAFIDWATSKNLNVDHETLHNGSTKFYAEKTQLAWEAWLEQAKKTEGCVVVPVQCPDPDFADMLFDELRKNAIGTFGDDMLIHFSNIDEEKIWALMIEAARGGNNV